MTENQEIAQALHDVQNRIVKAAQEAGRDPAEITLVAATKMNDAERVRTAIRAGLKVCGENRVQELLEKYEQHAYEGASLHFIGTLQTNKVKYLIGKVDMIESVSSIRLAEVIDREARKQGVCQNILLEVNIGREPAKSGFDPTEVERAVGTIAQLEGLKIRGLMAIPPISDNSEKISAYFNEMKQLFIDISAKKYDNVCMDCLSMGMSADFEEAIRCGATIVRVGTGIFGKRPYGTVQSK